MKKYQIAYNNYEEAKQPHQVQNSNPAKIGWNVELMARDQDNRLNNVPL